MKILGVWKVSSSLASRIDVWPAKPEMPAEPPDGSFGEWAQTQRLLELGSPTRGSSN